MSCFFVEVYISPSAGKEIDLLFWIVLREECVRYMLPFLPKKKEMYGRIDIVPRNTEKR